MSKKIISFICALALIASMFSGIAYAADSTSITIEKVYVDKACYDPGSEAVIYADLCNEGASDALETIAVKITHLNETVWSDEQVVSMSANTEQTISFCWNTPNMDFMGYLVEISSTDMKAVTAIDVSSDVTVYPRYGYTVDFFPDETSEESDQMMKELAQVYHINIVQYYDWMYRHEQGIPDSGDTWVDMFGNTLSQVTIEQRIDAGHSYNQKAMAYQMSYMAREGYEAYGVSREWGLYKSETGRNIDYDPSDVSSILSIDQYLFPLEGNPAPLLLAFDPTNTEWQDYMANQYIQAINVLDFDGIQIDQMGDYWGSDVTYYDYEGNEVDLATSFAEFTNAIKSQLLQNDSSKSIVTMNAVNGGETDYFSTSSIIKSANTDFEFSELWGNTDTYQKLNQFVNWQRMNDGGQVMVLAAYMNEYDINGTTYYYENATLNGVHTNSEDGLTYITGFDTVGDSATIEIYVPEDGNYSLVFYAANGTDTRASKSIYVDGSYYQTAYFDSSRDGVIPAEPDWYYYSYEASFTLPKNLYLTAGNHTLTIQQDADDIGGDIRLNSVTLGVYDENSVRLTNAVIAASGAMHIELGSGMTTTSNSGSNYTDVSLLGNPYYPKAAKSMDSSLKDAMYNQYQFITAYENLLYDSDVLPSDTGFQNISIEDQSISGDGTPGTIWYIIKNKGDEYGIIHLINLTGEDNDDWRDVTSEPIEKTDLEIKYYYPQYKTISGVYLASPDTGCISEALQYQLSSDESGSYITISVPNLQYWDMIYIQYGTEICSSRVEAEDSILSNVNISNDHLGFSGTGFVDSYGEAGDSVTLDFYVDEEGDYDLSFCYSAVVSQDPVRHIYINGYDYGTLTFPVNDSWDEWTTVSETVHLQKGIHRLVLYVENDSDGYINFDYMEINPSA